MRRRIIISGRPEYTKIQLQTRLRNDIDNRQVYEFSLTDPKQIEDLSKDYRGAIRRNVPNPIYNCHGMTFASSRTTIGPEQIQQILEEDGYTEVNPKDILPGDIVIYYNMNSEIEHSGFVVSKPNDDLLGFPWVVSKWGKYSEMCHRLYDCPYQPFSQVKYWRITKLCQ